MARTDNTRPIRLLEDELDELGFSATRILNTRTRRGGSFKHRERRRWNHADRARVKNDLRFGREPLSTVTRNTVRSDMW